MPSTRALIQVSYALDILFANFARTFIKCKAFNLCFEYIERFSVFHIFWDKTPNNWAHSSYGFQAKVCGICFWNFEVHFFLYNVFYHYHLHQQKRQICSGELAQIGLQNPCNYFLVETRVVSHRPANCRQNMCMILYTRGTNLKIILSMLTEKLQPSYYSHLLISIKPLVKAWNYYTDG